MTTAVLTRGQQLRTTLGEGIRVARTQRDLTVRDVCGTAGISLGYWCEVERGKKQVSFEILDRMCEALDISIASVLSYMTKG